jgi:hypothetical protein
MLDAALIEKSTTHAINKISNGKIIHPGLLFIDDFLSAELLTKLQTYVCNEHLLWQGQETLTGELYPGREKINWVFDTVIEETHIVLSNLTDYLNQYFCRSNKFLGLSIWKDKHTYQIAPHTDNPAINISMQIYLNDNGMSLGTKFDINNSIVEAPYITNYGYLMDNMQDISHYYDSKAPKDYYRLSLHAVWTDANK